MVPDNRLKLDEAVVAWYRFAVFPCVCTTPKSFACKLQPSSKESDDLEEAKSQKHRQTDSRTKQLLGNVNATQHTQAYIHT